MNLIGLAVLEARLSQEILEQLFNMPTHVWFLLSYSAPLSCLAEFSFY